MTFLSDRFIYIFFPPILLHTVESCRVSRRICHRSSGNNDSTGDSRGRSSASPLRRLRMSNGESRSQNSCTRMVCPPTDRRGNDLRRRRVYSAHPPNACCRRVLSCHTDRGHERCFVFIMEFSWVLLSRSITKLGVFSSIFCSSISFMTYCSS